MLEEFSSMPAPAVQAGGIMQPIDACNRWALGDRWACAGSRQGTLAPGTACGYGAAPCRLQPKGSGHLLSPGRPDNALHGAACWSLQLQEVLKQAPK